MTFTHSSMAMTNVIFSSLSSGTSCVIAYVLFIRPLKFINVFPIRSPPLPQIALYNSPLVTHGVPHGTCVPFVPSHVPQVPQVPNCVLHDISHGLCVPHAFPMCSIPSHTTFNSPKL